MIFLSPYISVRSRNIQQYICFVLSRFYSRTRCDAILAAMSQRKEVRWADGRRTTCDVEMWGTSRITDSLVAAPAYEPALKISCGAMQASRRHRALPTTYPSFIHGIGAWHGSKCFIRQNDTTNRNPEVFPSRYTLLRLLLAPQHSLHSLIIKEYILY